MSLFDQVAGRLGGALSGTESQQSPLAAGLLEMLQGGGLSGLVQSLHGKGLGDLVSSWISTGPNLPISASQIQDALGAPFIQQLAQKAGLPADLVTSKLAEILPTTVDSLTPQGTLPEAGALQQMLGLLKGRIG